MRRARAVEEHDERRPQRIGGPFGLRGLGGNAGPPFGEELLEPRGGPAVGNRLGDNEEGTPQRVVDPVIRGAAPTASFARNLAPGQERARAVLDPDRAVPIKISGFLRVGFPPGAGEFPHPLFRRAAVRPRRDLRAQPPPLRHPVEPDRLAQFIGRNLPPPFRAANPRQRPEP